MTFDTVEFDPIRCIWKEKKKFCTMEFDLKFRMHSVLITSLYIRLLRSIDVPDSMKKSLMRRMNPK